MINYGELIAGIIIVFIVFVYIMQDTGKYIIKRILAPESLTKMTSRTQSADRFENSMRARMFR